MGVGLPVKAHQRLCLEETREPRLRGETQLCFQGAPVCPGDSVLFLACPSLRKGTAETSLLFPSPGLSPSLSWGPVPIPAPRKWVLWTKCPQLSVRTFELVLAGLVVGPLRVPSRDLLVPLRDLSGFRAPP